MTRSVYLTAALFFGILATSAVDAAQPRYVGRSSQNLQGGYTFRDKNGMVIGNSRANLGGRTSYYDRYNRYKGYSRGPTSAFWPGMLQ